MKRPTRLYWYLVTGCLGVSLLAPGAGTLLTPAAVSAEEGVSTPTPTATPPGVECENELCT